MTELLDIPVNLPDSTTSTLREIAGGDLLLLVNTASKCGLTPQYAGLQQLADDYAGRGLTVVGAPCNQFGAQEPGSDAQIADFCSLNYGVSFPLLSKLEVNGENAHPVYRELTSVADAQGEAGWPAFTIGIACDRPFRDGKDGRSFTRGEAGSFAKPVEFILTRQRLAHESPPLSVSLFAKVSERFPESKFVLCMFRSSGRLYKTTAGLAGSTRKDADLI